MEKPWVFLDHTADVKYIVKGKSLEEAFAFAGIAMFDYLVPIETIQSRQEKSFEKQTNELGKLLFDYLDELLFYLDTESFLTKEVKQLSITSKEGQYKLSVVIGGDVSDGYETGGNIKAVTYHEMQINPTPEGYEIHVVIDV